MLEQIIITSLFSSAVMFLLYKWNLAFWKCDYCMGFWVGLWLQLLFYVLGVFNLTWNIWLIALCASMPTFLIISHAIIKHDNHKFTGRH